MATDEQDVLIPRQLKEMVNAMMNKLPDAEDDPRLIYIGAWIGKGAEREYQDLVKRENLPSDPMVISLLCELAVARSLIAWHEVKDKPPPMPSIL
jgi:hypothetical protein